MPILGSLKKVSIDKVIRDFKHEGYGDNFLADLEEGLEKSRMISTLSYGIAFPK
jgi:hypothetical protein